MRLLLAPEAGRAEVDALARDEGWKLVGILPREGGRPRQVLSASADGAEVVTLIEDHRVDARYLVLIGHDPAPAAERARRALPCLGIDDVLAMMERDRPRALCWLGIVAPETPTDPIDAILREASASEEARVRDAARFALEAAGWARAPETDAAAESAPPLPARPRLARSVLARMHVANGQKKVVLIEHRTNAVLEIDVPSYRALELADGTRDLDGLCLGLAERGAYVSESDLRQLFSELNAAGVLVDGLDVPPPPPPVRAPEAPLDRPLDLLPGFTLVCDGSGSCCRFYGSVAFGPVEAASARAMAGEMRLPLAADELFTPIVGAQLAEDDVRAVAQIDGRCAFLEGDGLCGLHRRGGATAKPFPCRNYPAMFMDDGTSVRVSLGPECACVFASAGRRDGSPLVPPEARTLADLGPEVAVMHVPDPVPLTVMRTAPREALASWSSRLVDALATTEVDAVALAWTLAERMAEDGLALERALERPAAPSASAIRPYLAALADRAREAAELNASWRGASDLSRRVARWIADALASADPTLLVLRAPDPAAERFYLRALAHGHRIALEGRTIERGLRDRATRMLAARAMVRVPAIADPSARYPLAVLEAAMRNLGLAGYTDAMS